MTTKEMLNSLANCGIISIIECVDGRVYVEDIGSEYSWAYITFDANGNAIKVEKEGA